LQKLEISSASLIHSHLLTCSLTTVARLETKQSSKWPPFYDIRIKSLVGYAFWGSTNVLPLCLAIPFISVLLQVVKPYQRIILSNQHFSEQRI